MFSFYKGNPKNVQKNIDKLSVLAFISHIMVQSISFLAQIATFSKTLLSAPILMRVTSIICDLSLLTSPDDVRCLMSAMTDGGHKLHRYGCLQNRLCKCSNLVEKWNRLDHYVRNESQYAPLAYFPRLKSIPKITKILKFFLLLLLF